MPRRLLAAALTALTCLALPAAAPAAIIPVTTNADSGVGSLRSAITLANATAARDDIVFVILPGGATTITLASALPAITQPVIINGASQATGIAQPVTITGANTHAGLAVSGAGGTSAADGTQIFGLRLTGFTGNALTVTGSYVLLQDSVVDGNTGDGVNFGAGGLGAVGGAAGEGNRISGNGGAGVRVAAGAGAVNVSFNTIGTNAAGSGAQANASGVFVAATGAQVFQNTISGNTGAGVELDQCALLTGNAIGRGAGGAAVPNGIGVQVDAENCQVGGSGAGNGNTISANTGPNLQVNADGVIVQGNLITDSAAAGIVVNAASGAKIGAAGSAANTISGNALDGITLTDAPNAIVNGNTIGGNGAVGIHGTGTTTVEALGNSIVDNGGLGIDVAGTAPVITSVAAGAGKLRVRGSFTAAASGGYTVELFSNNTCDPSGSGEGETPLGTVTVVAASAGTAELDVQIDAAVANPASITLNVTRQRSGQPGVTTKFSNCMQIAAATSTSFPTGTGTVNEVSTQATIHVIRSGDVSGGSTVDFGTSDGTATAGEDYTATSGTLAFAAGESDKTISVPLINDTVAEGLQTFTITLSNPSAGALGSPSAMTVTIASNDEAGLVVNSTGDTDDANCNAAHCTLREALNASNSDADRDTITFVEALGTISLTADLPPISKPVLIVGPATVDGNGHAVVRVLPAAGGTNSSDDTEIFGGIAISDTAGPAIDVDGARFVLQDATINAPTGIRFHGGASGAVGGDAAHGNSIASAGGDGVVLEAGSDVIVSENTIDANAGDDSVRTASTAAQVFRNTIIGGTGAGIALDACADVITGNTIDGPGVGISVNASGCQVGGSGAGQGNTVDGVPGIGILVGAGDTDLIGNTIRNGGSDGVRVAAGTGTRLIGNTIRENAGRGVVIANGAGALVRSNSITENGGLGIDVAPDGVTAGAPVLSAVRRESGKLRLIGTLPASAGGLYELEVTTNSACDASGFGEGATPIAVTGVLVASAGNVALDFLVDADAPAGTIVTVTATRAGGTSEFSGCVAVTETPGGGTTPPPGGGGTPPPQANPQSTITSPRGRVKSRRFKRIKGTAVDAARVHIAATRLKGGKCYSLTRRGRFKLRTGPGRCTPKAFFKASGTATWSYRLKRRFRPGRYRIYSRATAADGTVETPLTRVRVRVRR